jgi:hypothetical protein
MGRMTDPEALLTVLEGLLTGLGWSRCVRSGPAMSYYKSAGFDEIGSLLRVEHRRGRLYCELMATQGHARRLIGNEYWRKCSVQCKEQTATNVKSIVYRKLYNDTWLLVLRHLSELSVKENDGKRKIEAFMACVLSVLGCRRCAQGDKFHKYFKDSPVYMVEGAVESASRAVLTIHTNLEYALDILQQLPEEGKNVERKSDVR